MMALSLWQPWAWLVMIGEKGCETRSWSTNHRGPIALHAAQRRVGPEMKRILEGPDWVHWSRVARKHGLPVNESMRTIDFSSLPRGCIVAKTKITDVWMINPLTKPLSLQEVAFGDYTTGRFRWDIGDVCALNKPVPYKGRQRLFQVPGELVTDAIAAASGRVGA